MATEAFRRAAGPPPISAMAAVIDVGLLAEAPEHPP
jgi:hypothetical protein